MPAVLGTLAYLRRVVNYELRKLHMDMSWLTDRSVNSVRTEDTERSQKKEQEEQGFSA